MNFILISNLIGFSGLRLFADSYIKYYVASHLSEKTLQITTEHSVIIVKKNPERNCEN